MLRAMVGLALLAILSSSLILWWLNRKLVLKPVRALVEGTRRVAEGDLSTTIPVAANHELGDLAKAFNTMTQRIAEAQRALTQADKLASVGRLAAGVAHEINNPLTGVLSYATLLRQRLNNDPSTLEDLDVIIRETKRCRSIILEMLDFARPAPPARKPCNLNDVVRRAASVLGLQLQQLRVDLALELAPDLPLVFADSNQIQQVLLNLLLNARDAIPAEGGGIRIQTRMIRLPALGHAPIRQARCPKGHDLLDPAVRITGLPTLRLLASDGGNRMIIHLDPVFGRSNHLYPDPMEEGVLATYLCPECQTPLADPSRRCLACGAPVFFVSTVSGEAISWCTRKGCHAMTWPSQEQHGDRCMAEIKVGDNGQGIPPEDLSHLFEPFFTTKGPKGTGLGLSVTWGILEGHSGTIEVQSDLGKGTTFTVRLPLADNSPDSLHDPSRGIP
jgi:two-component system NtrC family sensor kinase